MELNIFLIAAMGVFFFGIAKGGFVGPISLLIKWMNTLDLIDAVLEEPDLETIFMNYYK